MIIAGLCAIGCGSSREPQPAAASGGSTKVVAPQPPPPGKPPLKICEEPQAQSCNWISCGGNSPVINSFPINGVRSDGECNPDGTQLVPGSMTGGVGDACKGATLDVRDNKLVGVQDNGLIACKGDALKGASFVVRGPRTPTTEPPVVTVKIDDLVTTGLERRRAYKLSVAGKSLCKNAGSQEVRTILRMQKPDAATGVGVTADPGDGDDAVIPIVSELYDPSGTFHPVETSWERKDPYWLQLACVDDALAKRSLQGLHTDNVEDSRAALHMFVANYCGNLHATTRGTRIGFKVRRDDKPAPASAAAQLEAKWDAKGAVCMSRSRLFAGAKPPEIPAYLTKQCATCTSRETWEAFLQSCKKIGTHPPTRPALPACEACTTEACTASRLTSYLGDAP